MSKPDIRRGRIFCVTANVIPIIIKPMMLLTADNRKLESTKAQRDGDP